MNELLISEISHSIFSHDDWPWVTEILENEEGIIAVEINGKSLSLPASSYFP